ncbi:Xylanase inhibitor N-terminal [Rhizoctonia solani]|uniref:Xylanase inhibitor N-terminal n=1 Tax=Rhizoctonia solani TaxID=456999 RepID=A0A8H7IEM9_9AGAM|nr:Xylanase inhibitor N-terminal [Rhizoctonia solani]
MQMRWHHPDLNVSVEQLQTTHARLFRRQAAQNTTITLTDIGPDLLWSGPVTVGSKTFNVDFDTGPAAQCAGKNIYTPSQVSHIFLILNADLRHAYSVQSSTSAKTPNTFQISFGDGSAVRANVFTDTVSIGGLAITNSGVGAVTQLSQSFTNAGGDTSDGLMGMAFPVLAESKQTPYFSNLAKLSPTQGMMSFKFVGKNAPGSELTVGGMNTAAFIGQVAFSPVLTTQGQPPSFWTINMGQASVGGKPVQTASQFATIDTGTSVVIAPQADAQAIYAAIPGSKLGQNGLFTYPCNANPDVALNFAGQNFNIKAADMSLGSDATNTTCVGAIVPSAQRNAWLVGDSFLKNVYTVFDQTNLQVGFAKLAHSALVSLVIECILSFGRFILLISLLILLYLNVLYEHPLILTLATGQRASHPLEEFTRLDDAVIAGIGTGTACPIGTFELTSVLAMPLQSSSLTHRDRTSRLLTTAAYVDVPSRCTACSYVLTPPRSHGIVRKTASAAHPAPAKAAPSTRSNCFHKAWLARSISLFICIHKT